MSEGQTCGGLELAAAGFEDRGRDHRQWLLEAENGQRANGNLGPPSQGAEFCHRPQSLLPTPGPQPGETCAGLWNFRSREVWHAGVLGSHRFCSSSATSTATFPEGHFPFRHPARGRNGPGGTMEGRGPSPATSLLSLQLAPEGRSP